MNEDINYIMSCSDDEFERVTGVRLPEEAWERWCNDMDKREKELQALFAKAIAAEREACARECEADGLLWGQRYAAAIRARGQA